MLISVSSTTSMNMAMHLAYNTNLPTSYLLASLQPLSRLQCVSLFSSSALPYSFTTTTTLLLLLTLHIFPIHSARTTPTSFCKCICGSNSTIIPLNSDPESDTTSLLLLITSHHYLKHNLNFNLLNPFRSPPTLPPPRVPATITGALTTRLTTRINTPLSTPVLLHLHAPPNLQLLQPGLLPLLQPAHLHRHARVRNLHDVLPAR